MTARVRKILITVAIAVLLVLAGILLASRRTVTYQGKTVYEWVAQLDPRASKRAEDDQARRALMAIGEAAVPELQRMLQHRPHDFFEKVRWQFVRWRVLRVKRLTIYEQQKQASMAAWILAEDHVDIRPLIPDLVWWFTFSNYAGSDNARALVGAGPEGIAVITNFLCTHPTRFVREEAAWALHLVPNAPGTVEALVRVATTEKDPQLRANAFSYFPRRGGPTNVIVPLCLKAMGSEDGYQRWLAADLLARYAVSEEVLAGFERALSDSDERVRKVATNVLGSSGAQRRF